MGDILFSERIELPCTPAEAFDLIASDSAPLWRLPLGSAMEVGVPIRVGVTLPANLGGQRIDVLGRIIKLGRPHLVVVAHELPWRGTISIRVVPTAGGGSVLRLVGSVSDDVVSWATRFLLPASPSDDAASTWRVGLLSSGTGPASVYSVATRSMATLAVEELNDSGGVLGRNIELVDGDDGTHPGLGAAELVRLKASGCDVVLANVTSATFRKLLPVARRQNVLLVHTLMNEGGMADGDHIGLGERPMPQAEAAIPTLMQETGGERFFLVGSDYSWPRAMLRSARRVIERSGGAIENERYLPLGTRDFSPLIESIDRHQTELVVSTFIGADEVAFEQQMHAMGVGARVRTVSFALDESTHEYIGPAASAGLWTVFSYFEALPSAENAAFLARYHARFGAGAPPVSSVTECVYEAVQLLAQAAALAGEVTPSALSRQLRQGVSIDGPRGTISTSAKGLHQPLYVARSVDGALRAERRDEAQFG